MTVAGEAARWGGVWDACEESGPATGIFSPCHLRADCNTTNSIEPTQKIANHATSCDGFSGVCGASVAGDVRRGLGPKAELAVLASTFCQAAMFSVLDVSRTQLGKSPAACKT
ncbi:hypothetical protein D3C71_1772810 [compost metagenome]